jgi:hypothetical protein
MSIESSNETRLSDYDTRLYQFIIGHFSLEELRTLCFGLLADYDQIPGAEKNAKARELVLYVRRRGETARLVEALKRERPQPWQDWELPDPPPTPVPPPTPPPGAPVVPPKPARPWRDRQLHVLRPRRLVGIILGAILIGAITLLLSRQLATRDPTRVPCDRLTAAQVTFKVRSSGRGSREIAPRGTLNVQPGERVLVELGVFSGPGPCSREPGLRFFAPRGRVAAEPGEPQAEYIAPQQVGPDLIVAWIEDGETGDEILRSINVLVAQE